MKSAKIVRCGILHLALLAGICHNAWGQQNIIINMAPIDGIALTPDNIFNYQVHASAAGTVAVTGTIRYRNSSLSLSYSFQCSLAPGLNTISQDVVHPKWQFSSGALQELFLRYKVLPEGVFEYCVTITAGTAPKEHVQEGFEECLYHRSADLFLINLIDPPNKDSLKEYHPMLSWIANYSFSTELSYRIRVAEIKQGQNAVNAILRNQPVYSENNLVQNTAVYPVYAKPLAANQPYAWAVDAYYKGILLGGSETWQFIIPDDTLPPTKKTTRSYVDIKRETGINKLLALGTLKLKYVLDDANKDELYLEIVNDKDQKIQLAPNKLIANYGDNRYVLNLADSSSLKHKEHYSLKITTKTRHSYKLSFEYLNPDFLN
jgi:hypothetical protein